MWLPDIVGWAKIVSHFLKPGGTFYIVEAHPLLDALADEAPADGIRIERWTLRAT